MARPFDLDEDWDDDAQLELADGERLPWLDAGDDDEPAGFDTRRLVIMGAIALALLAAVVGGIWFIGRQTSDEPTPDGSVIAAPEGDYKQRPADAGGKEFAGTGDISFAVGEGQTRESQLAATAPVASTAAPAPSIASTVDAPPPTAAPAPVAGGTAVQVGAYPRREDAEAGWAGLIRQTTALSGVSHRIVEGQADIGRVYRLQAVAGSRAEAQRLCNALKADGLACFVK